MAVRDAQALIQRHARNMPLDFAFPPDAPSRRLSCGADHALAAHADRGLWPALWEIHRKAQRVVHLGTSIKKAKARWALLALSARLLSSRRDQ